MGDDAPRPAPESENGLPRHPQRLTERRRGVGGAPYAGRMAEREQFVERDLRGARFVECDLSDVVMRGVEVAGMDIDAPWLTTARDCG